MNILYYLLPLIGGLAVAIQVLLNGILEINIGRLWTVFTTHIVGAFGASIFLILQFFIYNKSINFEGFKITPWYSLCGGFLGCIIVFSVLIPMGKLPLSLILALVTIGQLLFGTIIDHFGLFGFPKISFNIYRLIGICIIIVGGYLMKK